jgi:hypothetical protein
MNKPTHIVNTKDRSPILSKFHTQMVTATTIKGVSGKTTLYTIAPGKGVFLSDDQVSAID